MSAKLSGAHKFWARAQGLEKIERERERERNFSCWARAQALSNFLSALKLWSSYFISDPLHFQRDSFATHTDPLFTLGRGPKFTLNPRRPIISIRRRKRPNAVGKWSQSRFPSIQIQRPNRPNLQLVHVQSHCQERKMRSKRKYLFGLFFDKAHVVSHLRGTFIVCGFLLNFSMIAKWLPSWIDHPLKNELLN